MQNSIWELQQYKTCVNQRNLQNLPTALLGSAESPRPGHYENFRPRHGHRIQNTPPQNTLVRYVKTGAQSSRFYSGSQCPPSEPFFPSNNVLEMHDAAKFPQPQPRYLGNWSVFRTADVAWGGERKRAGSVRGRRHWRITEPRHTPTPT
jgi:hypothetical protein